MADDLPILDSFEQFFFEVPLYADYRFDPDGDFHIAFCGYRRNASTFEERGAAKFDGHCPGCNRAATYEVGGARFDREDSVWVGTFFDNWSRGFDYARCTRCGEVVAVWFDLFMGHIRKIGQRPSLADIALDEVSPYRSHMDKGLAAEFHKAVGLAAHGVGVGSFVYLRRVFERLIDTRFEDHRETPGWDADAFRTMRMEEKVLHLKDHLPEFLVENRKMYSILSRGIHELEEKQCLQWFEVMKMSILFILEDDKRKAEERAMRDQLTNAIKGFDAKPASSASAAPAAPDEDD